jgi:DNA topoisomerase-6 subunit B
VKKKRSTTGGLAAHAMALKQRDISISEFFTKNRHLLGFDNPRKALLTTIKEAVDNALDACEEAGITPEIEVHIKPTNHEDRFLVTVRDNGPGIVKAQIPNIFGKLLYGSKFHSLKQARGQQGIGISAAGMYGQLTTGQPIKIISRISKRHDAHYFELRINTTKNRPEIAKDDIVEWDHAHGTRVSIELEGRYQKGRQSVDEYLKQTAVANPHLSLTFKPPLGDPVVYNRSTKELPEPSKEIKPHPYGVELGMLLKMMKDSKAKSLKAFLQSEFSRVSPRVADSIIDKAGLSPKIRLSTASNGEADKVYRAIQKTKILSPPTNCISPIGQELLLQGLDKELNADFFLAKTRPPAVYRGNPFLIETGIAMGGDLPGDEPVKIMRFANRVPLLYEQSACAITKAIIGTDWRKYHVNQPRGGLPQGPLIIVVHMASVWVPFTSESKEAIASYPEIIKEIKLALQECGRSLGRYIRKRRREAEELKKKTYIEKYIPQIGIALKEILDLSDRQVDRTVAKLKDTLERSRKF